MNDQGMSCSNCHPVREENARLRAEVASLHEREGVRVEERDEARAEVARLNKLANELRELAVEQRREVARLEGLILAAWESEDPYGLESEALWAEVDHIKARRIRGEK